MDFKRGATQSGRPGNAARLCGWLAQREGGGTGERERAAAPGSGGKRIHANLYSTFGRGREKATVLWASRSREGLAERCAARGFPRAAAAGGRRGLGVGLGHACHGKPPGAPAAARWSRDLFDTRAEPEEILCSPEGSCPRSRMPRGCRGHPWRLPWLAQGWAQGGSAARQRPRPEQVVAGDLQRSRPLPFTFA